MIILALTPYQIAIIISVAVAVFSAICLLIMILLRNKKEKHSQAVFESKLAEEIPLLASNIIEAVGGADKIESVDVKMTRLSITTKEPLNLDSTKVENIRTLVMEKKVTFVIGQNANDIAAEIKKSL